MINSLISEDEANQRWNWLVAFGTLPEVAGVDILLTEGVMEGKSWLCFCLTPLRGIEGDFWQHIHCTWPETTYTDNEAFMSMLVSRCDTSLIKHRESTSSSAHCLGFCAISATFTFHTEAVTLHLLPLCTCCMYLCFSGPNPPCEKHKGCVRSGRGLMNVQQLPGWAQALLLLSRMFPQNTLDFIL